MSLPRQPFDFFTHGELPTPAMAPTEVAEVLTTLGITGELSALGSQQDQNFLVTGPAGAFGVLKLANPAFPEADTLAQDAAADRVAAAYPQLRLAQVLRRDGAAVRTVVETSQGQLVARMLNFLPGGTFTRTRWLSPAVASRMGRIAAQVSLSLDGFDHRGLERRLQWDLRTAGAVVELLAPSISDLGEREQVRAAATAAWAALSQVSAELPVQAGHFDLTDDNLIRGADGLPDAVIDFGDVSTSWRVAELAVTLSGLLHHTGPVIETMLAAVRGFQELRPLTEAEATALWPLVVLRGAVLVASGRQQAELDADNAYARAALDREWRIFVAATSLPMPVMTAIIRSGLGLATSLAPATGLRVVAEPPKLIDLGVTADATNDGAWLRPGLAARTAASWEFVAAPWGVPRLSESAVLRPTAPATVPTSITMWAHSPVTLLAPWSGAVQLAEGLLMLPGPTHTLVLHGLSPDSLVGGSADTVAAGTPLGTLTGRGEIQLLAAGIEAVPLLVPADQAPGWLALTADPACLLGIPATMPTASPSVLLQERDSHVAEVQEHYYLDPPQIERGWRTHLVDTGARAYLDMVNNVTSVGHAHPRITAAVSAQLARLNTNSRFHYAALPKFAEALAATLPDQLDQVFLVNSGSEATDLAIRLAMAATGRRDIIALAEAYHGWTYASDAVSTSVADNPNALATRPDWVHTVEAPNSYRGRWRDAEAWRYGPQAAERIHELAASGHAPAGFIAESISGNAGGIVLPDGYLGEVYAAVREVGGVAIADEVQVGYGRLGDWFWGFQQQGVVPDIVAVAKSMGNGHPLGAVITTRAVAQSYRAGGYFFSSTGGSPVSATVGLTVLDIIRDEGLQANARVVGAQLRAGLMALADRHDCVGTVHGHGLYLGLELVTDRAARTPDAPLTRDLCERLRQLGVIMQPTGDHGNVLKIKPPLVVSSAEADYFVTMVDQALVELR